MVTCNLSKNLDVLTRKCVGSWRTKKILRVEEHWKNKGKIVMLKLWGPSGKVLIKYLLLALSNFVMKNLM